MFEGSIHRQNTQRKAVCFVYGSTSVCAWPVMYILKTQHDSYNIQQSYLE